MVPIEVQSTWLNIAGLHIHCLRAGETGSPIILLHGAGVDSASLSWSTTIGPLSAQHRIFAPDLPGYGQSDKPDITYTMNYYVKFLHYLLDALHLDKVSLVGLSMGGGIALSFTLQFQARVDRLVLVDPYGIMSKAAYHKLSYLYVHTPLNELSYWLVSRSRSLTRWLLIAGCFSDPRRLSQELLDQVYQAAQDPSAGRAFASFQRSEFTWHGLRSDLTNRLHEITVPTLLVHGADDPGVPVSCAKRAHELIKHSELFIVPETKHWPVGEKPEECNRAIANFLAK